MDSELVPVESELVPVVPVDGVASVCNIALCVCRCGASSTTAAAQRSSQLETTEPSTSTTAPCEAALCLLTRLGGAQGSGGGQ